MLGDYFTGLLDDGEDELETKGGKPSKGTPADGRLKDNGNGKMPAAGDDDNTPGKKPKKPPFPGAAAPFKSGGKDK